MAENETKKVIKTEISKKDVDKKEASSKKESKPKAPELPPIVQQWTKDAVQYGLKEWFRLHPVQSVPFSEMPKRTSSERKEDEEHLKQLDSWNSFILSHLRESSVSELNAFLDWLFELYTEPYRRDVKNYLVAGRLRKLISIAYNQDSNAAYPLLEKVNRTVSVREYPFITFDPQCPLYGSIIQKTAMDQTRLSPLSDQDIISRLELFLQNKNSDVFTSWILAILQYTPSKVPADFDFNENRDSVKNWIHDQLLDNEDARELLMAGLIDGEQLQALLNDLRNQRSKALSTISLQKENERLNGQYQAQKAEIDALKKQLEDKDRAIEQYKELQRKTDYEKIVLNEKSKQSEQRLNLQILANERLVAENERRLQKATADATQADDRAEQLEEKNQKLSQELENVQADLDLAQSNLKNAEQAAGNQESRIQKIFLRNLAEGLAEPLHYLNGTGQFLALTYPEDGAAKDLPEFLSQVNKALSSMGLVSFGQDGEIVAYDPALHELADGMCSKGDSVVIRQCGWKIKGDVYKKAIVQKGE